LRQELRETLTRLREQLVGSKGMDAELRGELERALEEIRSHLGEKVSPPPETPLTTRLEALAVRFEQTHPLIAEALGNTIRALGRMGI